jgi:hypothetical protein
MQEERTPAYVEVKFADAATRAFDDLHELMQQRATIHEAVVFLLKGDNIVASQAVNGLNGTVSANEITFVSENDGSPLENVEQAIVIGNANAALTDFVGATGKTLTDLKSRYQNYEQFEKNMIAAAHADTQGIWIYGVAPVQYTTAANGAYVGAAVITPYPLATRIDVEVNIDDINDYALTDGVHPPADTQYDDKYAMRFDSVAILYGAKYTTLVPDFSPRLTVLASQVTLGNPPIYMVSGTAPWENSSAWYPDVSPHTECYRSELNSGRFDEYLEPSPDSGRKTIFRKSFYTLPPAGDYGRHAILVVYGAIYLNANVRWQQPGERWFFPVHFSPNENGSEYLKNGTIYKVLVTFGDGLSNADGSGRDYDFGCHDDGSPKAGTNNPEHISLAADVDVTVRSFDWEGRYIWDAIME